MTDKKTRKEINAVINKYAGRHEGKKLFGISSGIIIGVTLGLDLLLTGGIGTTAVLLSTGGAGLVGLMGFSAIHSAATAINAAGQNIEYDNALVSIALDKMESKLKDAFNKVSAPYSTQKDKGQFLALADEIEQDVRKLFPVFKIISGTPKDKYEFIVAEKFTAPGKKTRVTLTQARRDLQPPRL